MEVRIISREIIKPSSSTPSHLRTYKLSLMDQLSIHADFSIILFYSTGAKVSDHLKRSLSETLTHYYPFAGRVKDYFSVDCNDSGVTFLEAGVEGNISDILKQPEIDMLKQLLPHEQSSTQVIVAVQVNYFDCGGVAISVCFRHVIADAAAATNFIKSWATIASGGKDIKDLIFDCSSIFPPTDLFGSYTSNAEKTMLKLSTDYIQKRFVFDKSKIVALQEKIGSRTTRFEAVSALVWGAIIAAKRETREYIPSEFVATIPINLRKRMNPPIPEQCIGNISTSTIAEWPTEETINYSDLVEKLRKSTTVMNENHVRNAYADGKWFLKLINLIGRDIQTSCFISSLCRLPFYEADFGWEKPTWTTLVRQHQPEDIPNTLILLDTRDGEGIETWVGLPGVDMAKFKQNPDILAYASFNPSI
ncbi:hypothetical protein ACOSP7_026536 [Xanthoceras sorbifolium]|uniref:Uncharacterized protein n=1 Tax=Xanthoceras sorbifolium TaxID=99658 RepID=A0ABQ8HEZ1_9ROSI|nr:hypothetical protein JRO89_XS11G0049600 [Xanthoceras sorbifolium]